MCVEKHFVVVKTLHCRIRLTTDTRKGGNIFYCNARDKKINLFSASAEDDESDESLFESFTKRIKRLAINIASNCFTCV